jgi:hypothetical protein
MCPYQSLMSSLSIWSEACMTRCDFATSLSPNHPSKIFTQHADSESEARAIKKVGDTVKLKYDATASNFAGQSPGQVLENTLEKISDNHDRLINNILNSSRIATAKFDKDPDWTRFAALMLVRCSDLIIIVGG